MAAVIDAATQQPKALEQPGGRGDRGGHPTAQGPGRGHRGPRSTQRPPGGPVIEVALEQIDVADVIDLVAR